MYPRKEKIEPEVGMGATMSVGSDAYPYTIIEVRKGGKEVVVQADEAIRTDKNGYSDRQVYEYKRDPNGGTEIFSLRKNGQWVARGCSMNVTGVRLYLGHRIKYWDPHF